MNPATVRLFRTDPDFAEAVPAGTEPVCNFCAKPENAYGSSAALWVAHIFSCGAPVGVQSFERILTDPNAVTLPDPPFTGQVSDNFGVRSKITYMLGW